MVGNTLSVSSMFDIDEGFMEKIRMEKKSNSLLGKHVLIFP